MAILKPFPALRPTPSAARAICAPPYDVVNTEEARSMAEGNPLSFFRVSRPEIELAADVDPYSDAVYQHGAANLQKLIAQGHLFQDAKPCYYLYRQVMGHHSQTGVVAVASCAEYDRGLVKKHELTRPDKEDDRTRHINILSSQTGPVFLTYRATPEVDQLVHRLTAGEPEVDIVADDDVRHTAWVVSNDEHIRALEAAFRAVPALYIADGHHRSAAASRVARERTAANPGHTGQEPYNFFLAVSFPHNQMQILGYNRVVKDLNGQSADQVLARLGSVGKVTNLLIGRNPMHKGEVTFFLDGRWHALTWKSELQHGHDAVARLDVSILQDHVLTPMLAIGNPRTDKRISFVGGIRGIQELERLVKSHQYAIAFAMYPTSIEELMAIADEGGLMPPKSTWFEPKLRDAMMCHMIKEG
jgi:uncharacterized protein (DUF1015 family)